MLIVKYCYFWLKSKLYITHAASIGYSCVYFVDLWHLVILILVGIQCNHPTVSVLSLLFVIIVNLLIEGINTLIQWNLSNPTHQRTVEMCRLVQDVRTCLIRHTKGPGKCVGWNLCNPTPEFSDILWHPTKMYDPKVFLLTNLNVSIPTSGTSRHISLVLWCVGLDRFWHPVQADTFPRSYYCLLLDLKQTGK
jgi:hypothetical protein